jgi:hypothetical protein
MGKLHLIPQHLARHSISPLEIVLPVEFALEAIDLLEADGRMILGWEGWLLYPDGKHGHGGPQGWSFEPRDDDRHAAAAMCRATVEAEAGKWMREHPDASARLHVCITVRE